MKLPAHLLRRPIRAIGMAVLCTAGCGAWSQTQPIKIVLTGQSMIRADIRSTAPTIVSTMAPLLKGDVVFTNFEAVVAESGQPNQAAPREGNSLTPPAAMDALKDLGFNMLSLANNHSWDLRVPGIQNTVQEAGRRDLVHAGTGNNLAEAGQPAYLHTAKGTVALIAMASGLIKPGARATESGPGENELRVEAGNKPNEEDSRRILESIRDAGKHADLVMVYQHNHVYGKPFGTIFGEELAERLVPPEWIKQWAHAEIDAGADIVVMHGAPIVQGVEVYRGRPILYDLGNFIFNLPLMEAPHLLEPIVWESVIASVEFEGKHLKSVSFRPIVLNQMGHGQVDTEEDRPYSLPEAPRPFIATRGLPKLAEGDPAFYILDRLVNSSRAMGTTIVVKGNTAELQLGSKN
jgi:poly-gamma-glutamate capsule biosynthesis protein CapA/YwtB (metallophosphatase superfamily)